MHTDRAVPCFNMVQAFSEVWKKWLRRRARLAEFDNSDPAEMQHVAQDLGTSVSELRILAGKDADAAVPVAATLAQCQHRPSQDRTSYHV